MHTEEFILIPKRMFLSHQPVKNKILENPNYEQKAAQLSLFQRNQSEKPQKEEEPVETMSSVYENKEATKEETSEPVSEDSEIEPILKKQKISQFESIISELEPMEKNKIKRSEILLEHIMQSDVISIGGNDVLHINKEPLGVKVSTFLYNLQQSTKKIDIKKYSKILTALDISPHLVANTYAKQILENSSESEQEFYPSREKLRSSGSKSNPTGDYEETSDETTDKKESSQKKWSFFS